jgi:flavodoxin
MNSKNAKSLVAYFSREGKNYVSGAITDLPVGNTEVVARMIQKATGSDSFRIEAVNPYPEDYHETTDVAQKEHVPMPGRSLPPMWRTWMPTT